MRRCRVRHCEIDRAAHQLPLLPRPTVEQQMVLDRHAERRGSRSTQTLRAVETALTERRTRPDIMVPWSGFDLISTFNAWKKSEEAGRTCAGVVEIQASGLT